MPRLLVWTLLVALAAGTALAADKRMRTMGTTLINQIGGLADLVYIQRDDGAVASLPNDAAKVDFQGLLLGAPRRVDLARDGQFSALVLTGLTESRKHQVPWLPNAVLVGIDVDRGTVFAGPAFAPDPSKSPGEKPWASPPPPLAAPAAPSAIPPLPEGISAGTAWLDVPRLLALPRQDMRLALRVLYFDQASNPAQVEIHADGKRAGATPMAHAHEVLMRLAKAGQSVHKLPRFVPGPGTPPIAAPGVTFALGPYGGAAAPLALHVALRVEITPPMLLRPDASSTTFPRNRPPAALVRATVLVLMRDRNEPHVVPIEFPVWNDKPLEVGQTLDAAFSLDLAAVMPAVGPQAGYQVYVLAGGHMAGPRTVGADPNAPRP